MTAANRRFGARPTTAGVLDRHGVNASRPVLRPGSVPAPGPGTQRVPCVDLLSMGSRCGSLPSLYRDAVGALTVNTTASLGMIADLSSAMLRRCEGDVARLVDAIGPKFLAPHVDVQRVRHWFGSMKRFPQEQVLLRMLSPGVPVNVKPGGHLQAEIDYGNHPSTEGHADTIRAKVVQDVANGRALVFNRASAHEIRRLRISPLGVVEGRKLRIIHDLTFAGVNGDTDFAAAPACELGHVLGDVCRRVLYLRQRHGAVARVMLCRIDVKDAFRQIPVDPQHAANFGFVLDGFVVVDLRLQFGWRNSPGFWGLAASALEHSHNQTTFRDASVCDQGRAAVAHVSVDAEAGRETMSIPSDCERVSGAGGNAGDQFFVRFYVDDGILVEVRFFQDGRRLRRAIESLASDHFRLLGPRGSGDPPLLEARKILGWNTRLEVLGWILDTDQLTISLPSHKSSKLREILGNWPRSRAIATCKQISELTGFLFHISVVIRPGKFFVQRLLAQANMPSSPSASFVSLSRRRVVLGPEFHGDLEFWRWLVEAGIDKRKACRVAPMYRMVARPPFRTLFSDASKNAVGGYCLEMGWYWRYTLSEEEQSRFCGSSKDLLSQDSISINALELLGMVISAYMLVVVCGERPAGDNDCVLLRGDNEAAIQWVRRCRGGKEPRSGALMRLMGATELVGGWYFDSLHVAGILNDVADGISRWESGDVLDKLTALRPSISWQEKDLGVEGRELCTTALAANSSGKPLRERLNELTKAISGIGYSSA